MKDIYKMKMHETSIIERDQNGAETLSKLYPDLISATRVPGGWIYVLCFLNDKFTQFVPWHDSDRQIDNGGNYSELKAKLKKAEETLKQICFDNHDAKK